MEVKSRKPSTLEDAVGFAYLFEPRNSSYKRSSNSYSHSAPGAMANSNITATNSAVIPTKKFSFAELKEKRDKGLCYHCDTNFLPGHACKKLFILEGYWLQTEEDTSGEVVHALESMEKLETKEILAEIYIVHYQVPVLHRL